MLVYRLGQDANASACSTHRSLCGTHSFSLKLFISLFGFVAHTLMRRNNRTVFNECRGHIAEGPVGKSLIGKNAIGFKYGCFAFHLRMQLIWILVFNTHDGVIYKIIVKMLHPCIQIECSSSPCIMHIKIYFFIHKICMV